MIKINLPGIIYAIGDGYTDYQIKQSGVAKYFIAFTKHVKRRVVIEKADYIVQNFDELASII